MLDDFSVGIVFHTESVVQDAGDVVVTEEEEEVREWIYVTGIVSASAEIISN